MNRIILILLVAFVPTTLLFSQSPGGVDDDDLVLWLKADAGVRDSDNNGASNNEAVAEWRDNSPNDNDAENGTASRRPIYRTNIINGNPAIEFNGTKFLDTEDNSGIGDDESFIIFMVFKQNSFTPGGNDALGTFIIDRPSETNNLTSFKIINTDKYFYQRREDNGNNLGGPISVTPANTSSFVIANYYRNTSSDREGIYLNGRQDIDQNCTNGDITGPRIRIGNHAENTDTGGLNGYFSEMIIFDANLSTSERRRVQSYLAIKYAITLDQTTLTDYVRADGTVVYPAASTASYSSYINDIAGIGQDNNSDLDQDDSKSQNAGSVLRVYNPSSLGNGDFLVWGDNGASLSTPNSSDVGGVIDRRLSRVWRVAETGNVGTVTVEFDLSDVPGPKVASDLRLMVDGNGVFSGGASYYTGTLSGSTFRVTGINFASGNYFTIGTVNDATTPLPVSLTNFEVSYENPVAVASWSTATEINNDYFTLERAGEDLLFTEIGRKPGGGTSKIPRTYSMVDQHPYGGRSYYRLKQTDFDGTFSYSDTKTIFIEETNKQIAIFPNPNNGKDIRIMWGNSRFDLSHIEVVNLHGAVIQTRRTDVKNQTDYTVTLKRRLSQGLYVVNVYYNGRRESVKLMVQ